jgi:hypothetical protein
MTISIAGMIRKTMGWCPNSNTLASKRVMLALPVDEEFQPGGKGTDSENFSEMGWANKYRNYILLLTLFGIIGSAATLVVIKYLLVEGFYAWVILRGILIGIIYAAISMAYIWIKLNRMNHTELIPPWKLLFKSFVYNLIIMASVLVLSFTIGKENPVLFMLSVFFPSILVLYPVVVYWEKKNRKTIYIVEEKILTWRMTALPAQA